MARNHVDPSSRPEPNKVVEKRRALAYRTLRGALIKRNLARFFQHKLAVAPISEGCGRGCSLPIGIDFGHFVKESASLTPFTFEVEHQPR